MKTIPIAPEKEDAARKEKAFQEIAQALAAGDLVCIFPEGRLTADGEMSPFKSGITRILADTPVPVIPMALRGLWGSFFSRYSEGKAFRRWRGAFSRVELAIAPSWAPEQVSPQALQAKVLELRGERR